MKAVSHKIKSSFLLCIAMLPLIFAAYIQISEAVIHHQMKEELEQKNLVTIHIKSSQIIWVNKGKEVRVNGDMFDVESYSIKGDNIKLTGLFDKDEDALFAHIDNAQQKNNSDATGSISVLKWFGCFQCDANSIAFTTLSSRSILSESIQQNNSFQNLVLSCDTPPPKPAVI